MDPERPIEKLLRAFAKKRRDQAPDAPGLELHPATRRMLQGEVRRRFGSPEQKPASARLKFLRIPFRPVELLLVAAILAVLAALLLPSLATAKRKAMSVSAMSNLRQIGSAARMFAGDNNGRLPASYGEMTNYLGGDTVTIDPVSGDRFIYVGGGQQLRSLKSDSVLAYSPTDKKGRTVLFADGHVEVMERTRFSELTNRGLVELAMAGDTLRKKTAPAPMVTAAPAPAMDRSLAFAKDKEAPGAALWGAKSANQKLTESQKPGIHGETEAASQPSAAPVSVNGNLGVTQNLAFDNIVRRDQPARSAFNTSQQFVQTGVISGSQNHARNNATPILASFQVQQNGAEIRVVDQDGSVYSGYVQSGAPAAGGAATLASNENPGSPRPAAAPVSEATAPASQLERKEANGNPIGAPTLQSYNFRVAGMNQSLKQNVVFTGNLLAITNGTPVAPAGNYSGNVGGGAGGGGQNAPTGQLQAGLLSNSRISGTAVIGTNNQIEINAVPVAP